MTPRARALALCAASIALGACSERDAPAAPDAVATNGLPADAGTDVLPAEVREQVDAELARLFGSFEDPAYFHPDLWGESGFDPAQDAYEPDPGAARKAFAESARARFGFELERVRAGDFEGVHLPEYALELLLAIRARAVELPREARDADERAEIERRIVSWYPSLAESARIYRLHCATCHGERGGGDGPTAATHDPRPRDLTSGTFKFKSTRSHAKPTRADLLRVLRDGLPGTGMASFGGLSRAELAGAIDWVRWLALRAAVERELLAIFELEDEIPGGAAAEAYEAAWESWRRAASEAVPVPDGAPEATPERVARGRELFLDPLKGNCAQCHGEDGRGDGPASYTVAADGTRQSIVDDWGDPIRPRDLAEGTFRGGREPRDVYRRIWAGIDGTPMPALGETRDASGAPLLAEDELWDLVFFVLSLRR